MTICVDKCLMVFGLIIAIVSTILIGEDLYRGESFSFDMFLHFLDFGLCLLGILLKIWEKCQRKRGKFSLLSE